MKNTNRTEEEANMNKDSIGVDQEQEAQEFQADQANPEVDVNEVTEETDQTEESTENAQIRSLQAELEESKQRFMRAQADFDNFRRRTQKEKEELGKYASSKLLGELVPVFDNFERALAAITPEQEGEQSSLAKGVEMIFRQFEGVLKAEGLTVMESVGQPFNPEFHQAIMTVEKDEFEEGIVVEELQKGYILKDKVLRPAMVKVSGS